MDPQGRASGRHPGGRNPDASRDDDLRKAALELLEEVGYDALTMDSIAGRAKAGKNTIYRRWSGKAELVIDAFSTAKGSPEFPDTGSLIGDLYELVRLTASSESTLNVKVIIGMASALERNADLRSAFQDRYVVPQTARLRQVFERAVARGEIARHHDLDLIAAVFPALVIQESLTSGKPVSSEFMRRVMDEVVHPLAVSPPGNG